jgi:hypothetical protein
MSMPLEFQSISHGKIAFGFFNIETDMILLEHYFLFTQNFCDHISKISEVPFKEINESSWDIYLIENNFDIGNLMGAIYGIDLRGFIGAVYKLFPFPKHQEDFKQKAEGFKNRTLIEELIGKFAKRLNIPFVVNQKDDKIGIGEYLFNRASFQELIKYIWLGGFPLWKNDIRPEYVLAMKGMIEKSQNHIFDGLILRVDKDNRFHIYR